MVNEWTDAGINEDLMDVTRMNEPLDRHASVRND